MLQHTHSLVGRNLQIGDMQTFIEFCDRPESGIIFVGGVSGIGKTCLINHFILENFDDRDIILHGKYIEEQSSISYQGILQALEGYAVNILKNDSNIIKQYGEQIASRLYPNLKVLHEIIPSFKLITGPAIEVASLPAVESQNRFTHVISNLLTFIGENCRRLVLFLDDLQWGNKISMELIKSILAEKRIGNLYVFAAYRIEDVGVAHFLSQSVRDMIKMGVRIHRVDLPPLEKDDVGGLISQIYKLKNGDLKGLSSYVYEQASGNPLYALELLDHLRANDYLSKSPDNNDWFVRINDIGQQNVSKNIIDLLIIKFYRTSYTTQNVLKCAACIGISFTPELLSKISGFNTYRIEESLDEALNLGLIRTEDVANALVSYGFIHDRVKESIYRLIDDQQPIHLNIARALQLDSSQLSGEVNLDNIVYHYNQSYKLLESEQERIDLCKLEANAARRAKNSGAYRSAIEDLLIARELLPMDSWTRYHELSYDVYILLAEFSNLIQGFDSAERFLQIALERSTAKYEIAEIYNLKVTQLTNQSRWKDAVEIGIEGLKKTGIDLLDQNTFVDVESQLQEMAVDELISLPLTSERGMKAILSLLNSMVSPAYVFRPELLWNIVMVTIGLSIRNGNAVESVYAYEIYAIVLGAQRGDYQNAKKYAQLAIDLNEKLEDPYLRCKIKLSYATNLLPWFESLNKSIGIFDSAAIDGLNTGDLVNTGYCYASSVLQQFAAGQNIDEVKLYIYNVKPFLTSTHNPVTNLVDITHQLIQNLQGKTLDAFSYSDITFDESVILENMKQNQFIHGLHYFYVNKMLLAVLNNRYEDALDYVEKSSDFMSGAAGQFSVADHNFYHSLICLELYRRVASVASIETANLNHDLISQVLENQAQMEKWADTCSDNFFHKYKLIQAEILSVKGVAEEASECYQESLEHAVIYGFLQDAAIASLRYAGHCSRQGNKEKEVVLKKEASHYYISWGATRLAD